MTEGAQTGSHGFTGRLLGGLFSIASAQFVSQILTFLAGIVLARLLAPGDFGTVAMVLVYTNLIWLIAQAGFNSAIIYLDDVSDDDLATMYWANMAVNAALVIVAVVFAPLVGTFFGNDRLVPLIRVATLGLLIVALSGAQRALLEKRLDFARLARFQLIASFVYAVSAVIMAWAGLGVWALIVGRLFEMVAESVLVAVAVRWRPRFTFSRDSFTRLRGYGGRVWLGNMLYYGQENLDNLIVGRVLGAVPLGYYSFAFRLANVPRWFFAGVVGRVLFPSFASGKDQHDMLRRTYLNVVGYSVLVAIGLCSGLALVAKEFVWVVYGTKWLPSVPALQLLAFSAGIFCVGQVTGPVLLSLGRPGLHAKVLTASTTVLVIGTLVGSQWGIEGVAVGVLTSAFVVFMLGQFFVHRELGVQAGEYLHAVVPPVVSIVVMTLAVTLWRWLGLQVIGFGQGTWLVSAIVIGAVALLGTLVAIRAPQVAQFAAIKQRLTNPTEPPAAEQDESASPDAAEASAGRFAPDDNADILAVEELEKGDS